MVPVRNKTLSSDTMRSSVNDIAILKRSVWDEWVGVVRAEERSNLLRGCVNMGLGTKDVEHFMFKQEGLRFRRDGGGVRKDRDNIKGLMENKLEDSLWDAGKRRELRTNLRAKLEKKMVKKKSEYRRFIHKVRDKASEDRIMMKKHNIKKLRELKLEWRKEEKFILPEEVSRYAAAKVFDPSKEE